jgi:hypothetical protein
MSSAIPTVQSVGLLLLWLLWACLLFGGFVCGRPAIRGGRRMPVWTRMASSAALTAAGWVWFWVGGDAPEAAARLLIAIGMTLGLLGDLAMARLLPGRQPVLLGIGAFGLGHMAYITATLRYAAVYNLSVNWLLWAAWLVIGAAGWYVAVGRTTAGPLRWAALPYALLLASTAGLASGLALQELRFVAFAVGAALFLFSDLILAAGLFAGRRIPLADDFIWLTYGPGQMLIVFGPHLLPLMRLPPV